MSDHINRKLMTALDPKEEVRAALALKAPADALEVFQQIKSSITRKMNERLAEERKKFPGMLAVRCQIEMPKNFNYDVVVAILEHMTKRGMLGKKKNSKGDYEYFLS
jgi:hypothetical protein